MSDTKLIQAVLDKVSSVDKRVSTLDKKVDDVKKEVVNNGKRIDKLGLQIAQLEDDAPTNDEFDKLTKRVTKLETQASKN